MSYPARQGFHYPQAGWWDPFAEVDAMRRRLEQLFPGEPATPGWTGDIEVTETDDGWTVEAPLPGVPPEAVTVTLTDREVQIEGEAVSRQAEQESRLFRYRVTLPGEVLTDSVAATLEHGVLTVTLPRSQPATGRRVPVTTPGSGTRTSADEHPTEPLPRTRSSRTRSSSHTPASGPEDPDTAGVEPTTAPPYQGAAQADPDEGPQPDAPYRDQADAQPLYQDQAGAQPGAGYQQPDQSEDSVSARHPVPGQESPPAGQASLGPEVSRAGQHYPGPPPYLPWPNHSKTDQDHPT